ncbi:MAG: leucyl aminopeptidase family protein, partial [Alteraurantiacibacter sp.]|nr:leucyl aminopeptidase family protein [Alteraurantiacibacter sp.]
MSDKDDLIQPDRGQDAVAIHLVTKDSLPEFVRALGEPQRALVAAQKFTGAAGQIAVLNDAKGEGWFVLAGVDDPQNLSSWCLARCAETLPGGTYRLANAQAGAAMFGWQSAQYRFVRYRPSPPDAPGPRILLTAEVGRILAVVAEVKACALVADMVNTPAEDMGPEAIEAEARRIADRHGAGFTVVRGDALETCFPMVHAVGRAAARQNAPRLIEINWGSDSHPRLAIVGKGVSFDTGGLDIKPAAGMLLMKKDMGGAAHALALADLVMQAGLKVRLQCLVPAVENAISGNAFRPGDVLKSRKGLTVEIGNTDAEGRLILGDALAYASEASPDFILDFATLTGAARVAVGPDLPALFTRDDKTANALLAAGLAHDDPCWRLPLYAPYAEYLASDIADLNNSHSNGFAGASVAASFLDRFVGEGIDWAHFDTFAWRPTAPVSYTHLR